MVGARVYAAATEATVEVRQNKQRSRSTAEQTKEAKYGRTNKGARTHQF
jgi:hypothetical protein